MNLLVDIKDNLFSVSENVSIKRLRMHEVRHFLSLRNKSHIDLHINILA